MKERFWRNNAQVIDNELPQDAMVIATASTDELAQFIVDILNKGINYATDQSKERD